jgi:hypothetical protein
MLKSALVKGQCTTPEKAKKSEKPVDKEVN